MVVDGLQQIILRTADVERSIGLNVDPRRLTRVFSWVVLAYETVEHVPETMGNIGALSYQPPDRSRASRAFSPTNSRVSRPVDAERQISLVHLPLLIRPCCSGPRRT